MIDLKDYKIVEILYFKNSVEIKMSRAYSPDVVLAVSIIKRNGIPQLVITANGTIIFQSGIYP